LVSGEVGQPVGFDDGAIRFMLPVTDHTDCFPVERLPRIEVIGIPNLNTIGTIFEGATRRPMAKTGLGGV